MKRIWIRTICKLVFLGLTMLVILACAIAAAVVHRWILMATAIVIALQCVVHICSAIMDHNDAVYIYQEAVKHHNPASQGAVIEFSIPCDDSCGSEDAECCDPEDQTM